MLQSRTSRLQSPGRFVLFALALLAGSAVPVAQSLRTTTGSPCMSVCHKESTNTTASEIACLDDQYGRDKGKGQTFQDCVTCLLESTYVDRLSGETDVDWGLYNLRFAFTTCVFGYPQSAANISTPCTVGCEGIESASELNLLNPSSDNFHDWCGSTGFADNAISDCEFCYNQTYHMAYQQVFMANFLESVRYNCHFKTAIGYVFGIQPSRIFSDILLPSSLSLATTAPSKPGVNLGVVVAVPIVGLLVIVLGLAGCCFFFIRWRRNRVGRSRRHNQPFGAWPDPSQLPFHQGPGGQVFAQPTHESAYGTQNSEYGPGFGISVAPSHGPAVGHVHDDSKNVYSYELRETSPSNYHATSQMSGYGYEADHKTPYADQTTQSSSPPSSYVSPQAGYGQYEPDKKPPL